MFECYLLFRWFSCGCGDLLILVKHVNASGVIAMKDVAVFAKVCEKGRNVFGWNVKDFSDLRNGKSGVCAEKLKNIVLFVGARSGKASVKLLNDFDKLGLGVRFEVFKIDGVHGVPSLSG